MNTTADLALIVSISAERLAADPINQAAAAAMTADEFAAFIAPRAIAMGAKVAAAIAAEMKATLESPAKMAAMRAYVTPRLFAALSA
jgi:hypothetical protein